MPWEVQAMYQPIVDVLIVFHFEMLCCRVVAHTVADLRLWGHPVGGSNTRIGNAEVPQRHDAAGCICVAVLPSRSVNSRSRTSGSVRGDAPYRKLVGRASTARADRKSTRLNSSN